VEVGTSAWLLEAWQSRASVVFLFNTWQGERRLLVCGDTGSVLPGVPPASSRWQQYLHQHLAPLEGAAGGTEGDAAAKRGVREAPGRDSPAGLSSTLPAPCFATGGTCPSSWSHAGTRLGRCSL